MIHTLFTNEILHFNEGGLLGYIQHHIPGTTRPFDASFRLNGQPLQLPGQVPSLDGGMGGVGGEMVGLQACWRKHILDEDGDEHHPNLSFF